MDSELRQRWLFLCNATKRPVPRRLLYLWVAVTIWDTIVAQLIPKSWAQRAPRVYEVVEMTTGFLPIWVWLVVGMIIIAAAAIEFGYRRSLSGIARAARADSTAGNVSPRVESELSPTGQAISRDVSVEEAMAFLATGYWGQSFFKAVGEKGRVVSKAYDSFLQAAADGHVFVWGKRSEWGVYEPIQSKFWYENRIDFLSLCKDEARTESSEKAFSGERFIALMTSRAQVERLAPPQNEKPATYANEEILGAIRWRFLSPGNYFIAARGRGHYIDIFGVQASGTNESDEIITDFSGTVRSEITGREYVIAVNDGHGKLIDPRGYGIPAKNGFRFQVRFNGDKAINRTEFLRDFRRLTIRLRYNGIDYIRVITPEEIEAELARTEAEMIRNPPVSSFGLKKLDNA